MSPYVPPAVAQARMLADQLRSLVEGFDPSALLGHEAAEAVEVFASIKDLAAHAELLAAGMVSERHAWKGKGEPTAAHWLARVSGVGLSEARDVLATARRLADLPVLDTAARHGRLSRTECVALTDAGAVNPGAVDELLAAVGTESTSEFRDRCLAAKAAGRDPEAHHRALHKGRYLRTRTDGEGAFCLAWRTTPDTGAEFMSALTPFVDELFRMAKAEGRDEPSDAIAADALAAMAAATLPGGTLPDHALPDHAKPDDRAADVAGDHDGDAVDVDQGEDEDEDEDEDGLRVAPSPMSARSARPAPPKRRPPTKIIVRVDLPTVLRGHPVEGEVCEIPGYGPVPVSVINRWLPDSLLAVVCTKGVDVINVTHLSRKATAHQQTALQWLQPRCAAQGCARRARLEIDHREDWSRTKHTKLDELDHLCGHHHALKSRLGWQLVAGRGRRPMVPPDHPSHPGQPGRSVQPDLSGTAA